MENTAASLCRLYMTYLSLESYQKKNPIQNQKHITKEIIDISFVLFHVTVRDMLMAGFLLMLKGISVFLTSFHVHE